MSLVPGQYAIPRVDGVWPTSFTQISFPVSASSATTRLYIVPMYMTPSITSGVVADCRGAGRRGEGDAVDSPRATAGAFGSSWFAGAPPPRPGVGGTGAGVS